MASASAEICSARAAIPNYPHSSISRGFDESPGGAAVGYVVCGGWSSTVPVDVGGKWPGAARNRPGLRA